MSQTGWQVLYSSYPLVNVKSGGSEKQVTPPQNGNSFNVNTERSLLPLCIVCVKTIGSEVESIGSDSCFPRYPS